MDATIGKLREEISRLHGPARVPMLQRLWQELSVRYVRTGPGTPAALGHLSAAIEVMDEAYHLLDATAAMRGQIAGQLGWFLSIRCAVHQGGEADREAAIGLLAEALDSADLPAGLATLVRMSLGQAHLDRVMSAMRSAVTGGSFPGAMSLGAQADVEEASRQFQAILDGPPVGAELRTMAQVMLDLAEALLPLSSGDLARLDMGGLTRAVAAMQQLLPTGLSPGISHSILSETLILPDLARMDPLDYPVPDLLGDPGSTSVIPPRRPVVAPRASGDPQAPRRVARDRLAALVGIRESPVWDQVRELVAGGYERLAVGDLDAYVGAAATAVESVADDPVEAGLDRLMSAAGLYLRKRRDGDGWPDSVVGGGYRAVTDLLLAAAERIPGEHPAAAVVVEVAGGLLDPARPLSGPITGIAGAFGAYATGVVPATTSAIAFGELCRAVTAVTTGAALDPDPLATAVAGLAADHPWYGVLLTAAGQVRLAAAVHAGEAVAVEGAPDGLGPLLDALLRDDLAALRAAVDGLAGTARAPRIAAVLGAGYLELGIRAPVPERDDLAAAIDLLASSAGALEDADESLRTRTWWRLAEAYRRRGSSVDAGWSRDAGMRALCGGGLDPRCAARFAGWMLADQRAVEAYTALEIAAAGGPDSASLADDVCAVVLGVGVRTVPPPEVPAWGEVAAAVRKVGASALLYLHPTDGAGRTAGVLCVDPRTDRLDVLANVPVTDPLTSDDPAWSAILDRWSGGLMVAASGDLSRIGWPAVRLGDGRRLVRDVSLAHVSSGSQLIELAGRAVPPVESAPLFVADPRGDRDAGMADAVAFQRLCYPRSVCLGGAPEQLDGVASREEVLRHLPSASLVQLGCELRGGQLRLAGEDVLEVAELRGCGLVILTEYCCAGFGPLGRAFLDAGFSGAIGWLWPVPAPFSALALHLTHLMLTDHLLPPMAAVTAVQQWMLDPDRELPPMLPGVHRQTMDSEDLTQPALWAALAYHGS